MDKKEFTKLVVSIRNLVPLTPTQIDTMKKMNDKQKEELVIEYNNLVTVLLVNMESM